MEKKTAHSKQVKAKEAQKDRGKKANKEGADVAQTEVEIKKGIRRKRKSWKDYTVKSLVFWVILGITAGVLLGYIYPNVAAEGKIEAIVPPQKQFVIKGAEQNFAKENGQLIIKGENLTLSIVAKDNDAEKNRDLQEKLKGLIVSQDADQIVIKDAGQGVQFDKNEVIIQSVPKAGGTLVIKDGIDYFIKVLKLLVGPIIFLTIILGIVGLESLKKVGSIGFKAFIYFEIVSTFALAIGIFSGNVLAPGKGMNVNVETLDTSGIAKLTQMCPGEVKDMGVWSEVKSILKNAAPVSYIATENGPFTFQKSRVETDSAVYFVYKSFAENPAKAEKCGVTNGWIIPDPITPFFKSKTLQVLVMALVLAILISAFAGRFKEKILRPFEFLQNICFFILKIFMWFSPVAAFCAMAFLIGKFGIASLINMGGLLLVMLVSCLIFIFGVLGTILAFFKINVFKFMYYIHKEVLIVFATSSSESALAPLMKRLEQSGISKGVTGLVLPTGYSFNLDCTNIYLALSIIFLSQAVNVPLTLTQQISILIILMVTSKGAVGVTGSGFIVLAATLQAVPDYGISAAAVAILLGVDKFMSEMRAVGNLCGNAVAAVVVGAWDKQIDMQKFRYTLDNPQTVHSII
ncbi:MAG: cation:dicarboxylase symporter family transporter [Campylobacteraceae bacterium]|jgi:aerobic C4-dicarboxylate transport protein|nr:cation:dicarboxylase symporter family transporter [Campylobacteraceae bacterium]